MQIPSSTKSGAERQARRQNCKENLKESITPEAATDLTRLKFERKAIALIEAGDVTRSGNQFKVRAHGNKFYFVYKIQGAFFCACNDDLKYKICAHRLAAEMFEAQENLCSICRQPAPVCNHLACDLAQDEAESKDDIRARFHAAIDATSAFFVELKQARKERKHFTKGETARFYDAPRSFDYDYAPEYAV